MSGPRRSIPDPDLTSRVIPDSDPTLQVFPDRIPDEGQNLPFLANSDYILFIIHFIILL